MSLWAFPTLLVRMARKWLTQVFTRVSPVRRLVPTLCPLEDRTLLSPVAPGSWWYDDPTSPTVALQNGGPGWLEVSGGSGGLAVSPGAPPAGDGGTGTDPNPGHYAFSV